MSEEHEAFILFHILHSIIIEGYFSFTTVFELEEASEQTLDWAECCTVVAGQNHHRAG